MYWVGLIVGLIVGFLINFLYISNKEGVVMEQDIYKAAIAVHDVLSTKANGNLLRLEAVELNLLEAAWAYIQVYRAQL